VQNEASAVKGKEGKKVILSRMASANSNWGEAGHIKMEGKGSEPRLGGDLDEEGKG